MHTGLGGLSGAALNLKKPLEGALDGAAGALIGEIIGEAYSDHFLQGSLSPEELDRRRELGIQYSKLGAALGAMVLRRDPDIMTTTAENAARYNSFARPLLKRLLTAAGAALTAKNATEAVHHGEQVMDAVEQEDEEAIAYHSAQGTDSLINLGLVGGTSVALKGATSVVPYARSLLQGRSAAQTAEGATQAQGLIEFLRFKYGKNAVDAGIKWGKGIQGQGMPWENYLASLFSAKTRLPQNFKTFDFYDRLKGLAISAKTLNTLTPVKLAKPMQIYASLKKNIDATLRFEQYALIKVEVEAANIITRELHVAIPRGTTPAQWIEIIRAIQYGQRNGVVVKITKAK